MMEYHYQQRWETIVDERIEQEQIVTTKTVDGKQTQTVTETERRYVVLETVNHSCRMLHKGVPVDQHFSTYFGLNEDVFMEDTLAYAKRFKVDATTDLVIEMIRWCERAEYVEAYREEPPLLRVGDGIRYRRTDKRIEETEPEVIWTSKELPHAPDGS